MKASEINKYLPYADENVDLMVISREQYDTLVRKARKLKLIEKIIKMNTLKNKVLVYDRYDRLFDYYVDDLWWSKLEENNND